MSRRDIEGVGPDDLFAEAMSDKENPLSTMRTSESAGVVDKLRGEIDIDVESYYLTRVVLRETGLPTWILRHEDTKSVMYDYFVGNEEVATIAYERIRPGVIHIYQQDIEDGPISICKSLAQAVATVEELYPENLRH